MSGLSFILSRNSKVVIPDYFKGASHAKAWLYRDLSIACYEDNDSPSGTLYLKQDASLLPEQYCIEVKDNEVLNITASDTLGAIYAILFISRTFLEIDDFWFWLDKPPVKKAFISIPVQTIESTPSRIKLRGWFINDEVLLRGWKNEDKWERVFETLLRCGGNMVIPGTDKSSHENRELAETLGLTITHHHAEPLGAKMFSRVHPEKTASYTEYPHLFEALWQEAIDAQPVNRTIWNLGFRGQGDHPFWDEDPHYTSAEERGKLISEIILKQYNMVKSASPSALCCTNLYGEIMELYQQGHLTIPADVITIWADNGFGKMVSRRQWNHNPRIYSLPENEKSLGAHGVYYHVTFYDLQASNHLTPFPNDPRMMINELNLAFRSGVHDFLVVNCGNVRPHVFYLKMVSDWWNGADINIEQFTGDFIDENYSSLKNEIIQCYLDYHKCHVAFGNNEDEHAGEQFYHYCVRDMISPWMQQKTLEPLELFKWLGSQQSLIAQTQNIAARTREALPKWAELKQRADAIWFNLKPIERKRFYDSFVLPVDIHFFGCRGLLACCEALEAYVDNKHALSFAKVSLAIDDFRQSQLALHRAEHGKWRGFYDNDCLTNIALTIEALTSLRGFIRMAHEPEFYHGWAKTYLMPSSESKITLLSNDTKHLNDDDLGRQLAEVFSLYCS